MYNLSRWKKLRKIVIDSQPYCQSGVVCDPSDSGRRAPSRHCDHIIPVTERPDLAWDIENLQGLCPGCHSLKTATEDSNFVKTKTVN